ncbi:MAG: integration host factor subunit beta [Halothiobacillaceae bacterium]
MAFLFGGSPGSIRVPGKVVHHRAPPGGHRTTVKASKMTKSELIDRLAERQEHLQLRDVEASVKLVLQEMMDALARGERIEIRGFGSFSLHFRKPRVGRNPKTGEAVQLPGKHVPHFKPGKALRERVNEAAGNGG